ncbi:MAG: type IV pilus biogenesis/stability protein PilW [Colwellia sp.]|nr:type IV pilus biogenesis/stability protein PilW [Colwellia sp.]
MDKSLKKNQFTVVIATLLSVALSGCVTQSFENGKTPVVQNQANRDDMAATRISLGLGYLNMGDMPQAKKNLETAKNFAPNMVQVYTAFAHYYETVGEHKLTVTAYEKALSMKSDDADTLNNYGVYLCRQNKVAAAEAQFLKAIAVPSYILVSKSYENLSSCFLKKDNFVKAERYLSKAVSHNPSSGSILLQMVRLQYAMSDYKQAKFFQQRFEKITRRFTPQSLALAYKVYLKLGQRRTAKNYGTMLVKMYPQSWETQQYLLNELELIEADNLAKRYRLTQKTDKPAKSKKRTVKLSPKQHLPVKTKPLTSVETQTQVNRVEKESNKALLLTTKTALVPVASATTASTAIVLTAITSIPTASSASINAALTMTENELQNTALINAKRASAATENLTVAQASTKPAVKNKKIVVLSSPQTEPMPIASEKATTETIEVVKKEIPLEDTEIFHIAKKPIPIVEESVDSAIDATMAKEQISEVVSPALIPVNKKPAATKNFPDFHVVESGDTLYNISVKYNIKIKALRRWNKIVKNKRIHIKEIIFLENPKSVNQ